MADMEIRTLSLPFTSAKMAKAFVRFAESFGYAPATKVKGSFHFITITFQSRSARDTLLKGWARRSRKSASKRKKKTRKEKPMADTETPEEKPEPAPEPEPPPPPDGS
jgi:hypothetical protein